MDCVQSRRIYWQISSPKFYQFTITDPAFTGLSSHPSPACDKFPPNPCSHYQRAIRCWCTHISNGQAAPAFLQPLKTIDPSPCNVAGAQGAAAAFPAALVKPGFLYLFDPTAQEPAGLPQPHYHRAGDGWVPVHHSPILQSRFPVHFEKTSVL